MFGMVLDRPKMWILGGSLALLVFFAFLAVLNIAHRNATEYAPDDQGLYQVHSDQCERPIDRGRIVELHNTLSNVGYALAGMLILLQAVSWSGRIFAVNLIVLSVMSGAYHATLESGPQELDVAWVYGVLLLLSAYASSVHAQADRPLAVSRWVWLGIAVIWVILALVIGLSYGWPGLLAVATLTLTLGAVWGLYVLMEKEAPWLKWILAPVFLLGLTFLGYEIKHSFRWNSNAVFGIVTALLVIQMFLVLGSAGKLNWRPLACELLLIGGVLIAGLVFRLGDGYSQEVEDGPVTRNLLCAPDFPVQPHALWHLLSALALLLSYDLFSKFGAKKMDRPVILPEERNELTTTAKG